MTDQTSLSTAAVRKQVEAVAAKHWPWLTQKQRDVLGDKLLEQIGAETLARSVMLSEHEVNEATLQSFVYFDASLVRTVPTASDVVAFKLKELEAAGNVLTPELKINTARSVAAMSDDDRIAAVPKNFKPDNDDSAAPAAAPINPHKPSPTGASVITDAEVGNIVGKPEHLLLASDRSRVLAAAKHVPLSVPHDAKSADQLSRLDREMTPVEKITAFRLAQQQKKAS